MNRTPSPIGPGDRLGEATGMTNLACSATGVRSVFAVMGLVAAAVLIPNRRITEQALSDAELV